MNGHPLLHQPPAAGFDSPFEMLAACHDRIERMLALAERLQVHLPGHGCDRAAVEAAHDLMRYFDSAAPAHHLDEERHVLPALRAIGDEAFAAQLEQEHAELQRRWKGVRRVLLEVAGGTWCAMQGAPALEGLAAFAAMYRAHAAAEDKLAYPAARATLDTQALQAMGQEMAARRGVRAGPDQADGAAGALSPPTERGAR